MGSSLPPASPPRLSLAQALNARTRVVEARAALGDGASFRARVALEIVLAEVEHEVTRATAEAHVKDPPRR